jgi:hypothetical protein
MPMGPEEIGRVVAAYEQTLQGIGLVDRDDPLAEMVAKKVIQVAQTTTHYLKRALKLRFSHQWKKR